VKDDKRKPKEGVLQLVGRDTKTRALVRYNAQPPEWSASDGTEEFTHWMRHKPRVHQLGYGRGYAVATSKSFAIFWTGRFDRVCNAPNFWHVNDETPEWVRQSSYSQSLEENKETRIGQVLRWIVLAFSYSPPPEANEETRTEQGFSLSQWLEANQDTRCTVDLVELKQAWRAKAEGELAELLQAQAKYDEFKELPLIVLPD
jgi:hypothetical protein